MTGKLKVFLGTCLLAACLTFGLGGTPAQASCHSAPAGPASFFRGLIPLGGCNHTHPEEDAGYLKRIWEVICTINPFQHIVMPALIAERDAIVEHAQANMSFAERWWNNIDAVAALDLPRADADMVVDTYNPAHGALHEKLQQVARLALASGYARKQGHAFEAHLEKAYGASSSYEAAQQWLREQKPMAERYPALVPGLLGAAALAAFMTLRGTRRRTA